MAKATVQGIPVPEEKLTLPGPAPAPEAATKKTNRPRRPDVQAAGKIDFILGQLEPDVAQRALAMVNAWYQPTGEAK